MGGVPQVALDEHPMHFRRQQRQRPAQQICQLVPLEYAFHVRIARNSIYRIGGPFFVPVRVRGPKMLQAESSPPVQAEVARDAGEPLGAPVGVAQGTLLLPGDQQRFLRQVLSRVRISGEPGAQPHQSPSLVRVGRLVIRCDSLRIHAPTPLA